MDDLSGDLAGVLDYPEVEEDVFDTVVRVLSGTDYLAVTPVSDSALVDRARGEPYWLDGVGTSSVGCSSGGRRRQPRRAVRPDSGHARPDAESRVELARSRSHARPVM